MTPLVIVACAAGFALYLRVRRRQPIRLLARRVREVRALAEGSLPLRAPTPDDSELVQLLWRIEDEQRALEALGFKALGELIFQPDGGEIYAVMRVLVDDAGTTCASLSVYPQHLSEDTLVLETHAPDEHVSTRRHAVRALVANPPFVRRQLAPPGCSHAQLVARHRTFARLDEVARRFEPITTLDEWREVYRRSYDRSRQWRAAQPPGELLEADLRSLLGDAYFERYGKAVTLRLTNPPPMAIALRRR